MNDKQRFSVFFTAPYIHPSATGEEFVSWKWAKALSEIVDLTVFSFQRRNRQPLAETLPRARVYTTQIPQIFSYFPRLEAMAKPSYPLYLRAARRALGQATGVDLAHQIMPQAPRYPIAVRGMGVPYVVGPLGGALRTPPAFQQEGRKTAWFTKLRAVDQWRFRYDPWLRAGYEDASLVLGVARYVEDTLAGIKLKRFETMLELGIDEVPPLRTSSASLDEGLHLLHVGRGVRTKGLRDVIRAMAHLKNDIPELRLTSAGAGEEIEICRQEAKALGIADRVEFLGLIPRQDVETLYQKADIFVFPSYREPAGNVLFEAMRWGLPVVAAARGGPDTIVDDKTGIRIPVTEPDRYARDIAAAIRTLVDDPKRRADMGHAAREKLKTIGLWPVKAQALVSLYRDILGMENTAAKMLERPQSAGSSPPPHLR